MSVAPYPNKQTSDSSGAPILEAVHLQKDLPVGQGVLGASKVVHAVQDASLSLYPGQVTALVGESGSGKTTIARLLSGIPERCSTIAATFS